MSPVDPDREREAADAADDAALAEVVAALRAPVPVRAEWRAAVLREAARPTPRGRWWTRPWTFRPAAGIAAGLLCAALGAGGAWLAGRANDARAIGPATPRGDATGGGAVRFVFVAPRATHVSRVSLVGDFNRWNPEETPMRASADGLTWSVELPLAPGRHVYAFVVDGDVVADPAAPRAADEDFGVPSSVVLVGSPSA